MAETRNPWDRREGESSDAFEAFVAYRDLGPQRSIDKAWVSLKGGAKREQTGRNRAPGRFFDWSAEHDWVERAQAYDDFTDAQSQAAAARVNEERVAAILRDRDAWLPERRRRASLLLRQGEKIAAFPTEERTIDTVDPVTKAPVKMTVMPTDPAAVVAGAKLIQLGETLMAEAIRDGLIAWTGDPHGDAGRHGQGEGEPGGGEITSVEVNHWGSAGLEDGDEDGEADAGGEGQAGAPAA